VDRLASSVAADRVDQDIDAAEAIPSSLHHLPRCLGLGEINAADQKMIRRVPDVAERFIEAWPIELHECSARSRAMECLGNGAAQVAGGARHYRYAASEVWHG